MNFAYSVKKAIDWMNSNSTNEFVYVSSRIQKPYNEVTGYFIPTLINYGFRSKAYSFSNYLVKNQRADGSWGENGEKGQSFSFDTAQIIDGLCEFKEQYQNKISLSCQWVLKNIKCNRYLNPDIKDHCDMRVLSCLKKAGVNVDTLADNYVASGEIYKFNVLSHMYGYAFEGCARLGIDCTPFIDTAIKYNGIIPERYNYLTHCFVGVSQFALSFALCDKFDLAMRNLEFVSKFQNASGGFYGSNGIYLSNDEISWAIKFYLDAFWECQKLWFKNNIKIFPNCFEGGLSDPRLLYIKDNIKLTDKVLDVGCGKGRYINNLDCDRYACDIADASQYVNARFSIGSCLSLPYPDKMFDIVVCAESLEHSIILENAIRECMRVLNNGGKLLIIDKNKKTKTNEILHFGEEWIDFDLLSAIYSADITEINSNKLAYPFYTAKIIKK